jgi:hypothetical protein
MPQNQAAPASGCTPSASQPPACVSWGVLWGTEGALATKGAPPCTTSLQVGLMSWGERFEVANYQAYDIGGPLRLQAHHFTWPTACDSHLDLLQLGPLETAQPACVRSPSQPPFPIPSSPRRNPLRPEFPAQGLHQCAVRQPAQPFPWAPERPAAHRGLPGAVLPLACGRACPCTGLASNRAPSWPTYACAAVAVGLTAATVSTSWCCRSGTTRAP